MLCIVIIYSQHQHQIFIKRLEGKFTLAQEIFINHKNTLDFLLTNIEKVETLSHNILVLKEGIEKVIQIDNETKNKENTKSICSRCSES